MSYTMSYRFQASGTTCALSSVREMESYLDDNTAYIPPEIFENMAQIHQSIDSDVKELEEQVEAKDKQIEELEQRIADLESKEE